MQGKRKTSVKRNRQAARQLRLEENTYQRLAKLAMAGGYVQVGEGKEDFVKLGIEEMVKQWAFAKLAPETNLNFNQEEL